jgi:competence protein ComEC
MAEMETRAGVAGIWPAAARRHMPAPLRSLLREGWLSAAWEREREARRPFLFLPVGMGAGVLLYFAADREPALWAAPLLACMATAAMVLARNRGLTGLMIAAMAILAMAVGFSASAFKAWLAKAPVIQQAGALKGTGVILQIDRRGTGARLVIGVEQIDRMTVPPNRLRLTARQPLMLEAGARIDFAAYVLPPPQPSRPGGYDFARDAWFAGIGGVGSLQGKPVLAADQSIASWRWRALAAIDRARNDVTARIAGAIGGQAGEVAAALITGKRGGISEETNEILRAAGIYHVVSISGLHMVLAAGMVFFLVRALFALSPAALLALPVKSIAAVAAILAAIAYDIFAGSEIATERSLIMTMIVFGAVLAHRRVISMRNLALAALLLILLEPETVVGPSFQMSFCAVMGLVALYERAGVASAAQEGMILTQTEVPVREAPPRSVFMRALHWIAGHGKALILTTVVAELTTAPFALYHFQQLQPLGLLGNALVLPLISVVVMPAALIGMIALPFGLDAAVWIAMGWGVELMLVLARFVASLPFSVLPVPAPAGWTMALAVFGLVWMALWTSLIRWAGLPMVVLGFALAWIGPRPDLFVAADGKGAALRGSDGRLALIGPSPGGFALEQWLRATGDPRKANDPSLKAASSCDRTACILKNSNGYPVSFIKQASAFDEDCDRAKLIVTPLNAPRSCATTILDRTSLSNTGAVIGFRTADGGWRFEAVRTPFTDRYWRPSRAGEVAITSKPQREPAASHEDADTSD